MEAMFTRTWRATSLADDAESLDEIIGRLEAEATELRRLRDMGVVLTRPVEDDYAFLGTNDVGVASSEGFEDESIDEDGN